MKNETINIPTGYYLDKFTKGLHERELTVIAARLGMGKTSFALNLMANIASNNKTVALFNMEMGAEQIINRVISKVGQININKIITGMLNANELEIFNKTANNLIKTKIFIDDTSKITVNEIKEKCLKLAKDKGLDVVIVDYLELISSDLKEDEVVKQLKQMAEELNVPVIVLSELSKTTEESENKKLKATIEDIVDNIIFLHHDGVYNNKTANKVEFIITKNSNGPTKNIELLFEPETLTFFDINENTNE